ncbi:MAG: sulfotransferase [Geminicoccaceae bacterium]|nr:sulfotransferase [Geminicoccaceae bacterium]
MSGRARLVVVLCPERSGSTLLAAMLGGHPRIVAPPELHLLRYPDVAAWRAAYPAAAASFAWLLRRLDLEAEIGPLAEPSSHVPTTALLALVLERSGSELAIVDKTPAYGRDERALHRAEALQPFYVRLLRHPLAVAASWLDREGRRIREASGSWPWPLSAARTRLLLSLERNRRIARALARWTDVHERVGSFLATVPPSRQITLRYEDLLASPEAEAARICAMLGLEPDPRMLAPERNLPDPLRWHVGDEKIRGFAGIDRTRATAWQRELGEVRLPPRTAAIAASFGYTEPTGRPPVRRSVDV